MTGCTISDPGPAHPAKNAAGPGLPNQTPDDYSERTSMVDTPRSVSWETFLAAVNRAHATGYAYGRLDQRWEEEPGPLVPSPEFVTAALERDVTVGGFEALYVELQATKREVGA